MRPQNFKKTSVMHALKSVFIIILITKVDENHESLHNLYDMICFSQALCHSRVRISVAAFAMAFGSLAVSAASKNTKKPKRGQTFQDTIIENLDCRSCKHGCKAKRCSSLATGFPPPIGETTIDFQRMQQVRKHTCYLEYPKWPSSHHLPPIAMHLCFCPFHPSY